MDDTYYQRIAARTNPYDLGVLAEAERLIARRLRQQHEERQVDPKDVNPYDASSVPGWRH